MLSRAELARERAAYEERMERYEAERLEAYRRPYTPVKRDPRDLSSVFAPSLEPEYRLPNGLGRWRDD